MAGKVFCSVSMSLDGFIAPVIAPVENLFAGARLFEGVDARRVGLEQVRAVAPGRVTHLTHAVRER